MPGPVDNTRNSNNDAYVPKHNADVKPQDKKTDKESLFSKPQGQYSGSVGSAASGTVSAESSYFMNGTEIGTTNVEIPYTMSGEIPYESAYSGMGLQIGNSARGAEQKPAKEDIVGKFKQLDKDGDLKVSAQEYTDNIVEEYVRNGHQLPTEYGNIAEFIEAKYAEFKNFAGGDVSMNIDEFRNMIEVRLNPPTTNKPQDIPHKTHEGD